MGPSSATERIEVLVVEDNPADVRLIQEALGGDDKLRMHFAANGIEALKFLRREGDLASAPRPQLVLLDLNMPRMDGRELLRRMKSDQTLGSIPVVVLTTTDSRRDINLAYQLGASCFLTKPPDLDDFFSMMGSIQRFWGEHAVLPAN